MTSMAADYMRCDPIAKELAAALGGEAVRQPHPLSPAYRWEIRSTFPVRFIGTIELDWPEILQISGLSDEALRTLLKSKLRLAD